MVQGIGAGPSLLRLPQELPDPQSLRSLPGIGEPRAPQTGGAAEAQAGSFGSTLKQFLGEVNDLQLRSDGVLQAFVRGEVTDLHQVVLAQQEAAIALRLVSEMRDRMVAAYQEVMRTSM
jgi:flagellar hook-basal body complex protein FliE